MRLLDKSELLIEKIKILRAIKEGAVFIYPTDTIYGIGCNALLDNAVNRIRELKKRDTQPFSVIAPNKKWIKDNCFLKETEWLEKLPGPYTLILKQKKPCVSPYVNPGLDTLGVRIPEHWFTEIVTELKIPIVTTSVNKAGEEFMTSLDDLDPGIRMGVNYIIYEGHKQGKPSTIVELLKKPKVKRK